MQYLSELLLREVQPEELERMHVQWCESDAWKHGGGRYVKQDLAEGCTSQNGRNVDAPFFSALILRHIMP